MATFKPGQRVKIIESHMPEWVGVEGIFGGYGPCILPGCQLCDCWGTFRGLQLTGEAHCLAPLTDPKADDFIESLEKLGREPQADAPHIVQPTRATIMERDPDYYREDE